MNMYIWTGTDPVSDSYHSRGGLLVVADALERARELALESLVTSEATRYRRTAGGGYAVCLDEGEAEVARGKYSHADWMKDEPNLVYELAELHEEKVVTFPDSGCC